MVEGAPTIIVRQRPLWRTSSMSASTIMATNSANDTVGSQPNSTRALEASPT